MRLRNLLLAVPLVMMPAQTPARPIAAYWQALSAARSIGEANSVARPENGTRTRDGDIAAGLLKFREYELAFDKTAALVATRMLEKVNDRTPDDPWAHYALGLILARGPDVRERPFAERAAYKVFSKGTLAALHAPRELKEALRLDPKFEPAAIEYGQLAIDFNDRDMMRDAVSILSGSAISTASGSSNANLMIQARLHERLGQPVTANRIAAEAEGAGADPSVAAYQRASSLFRTHRNNAEATAAYFDGVNDLTDNGADLYFASLELILTSAEAAEWQKLSLDQKREWLRHFWEMRAALTGVDVSDRLAEHFRRLAMLDGFRSVKTSPTPTAQSVRAGNHPSIVTEAPQILSIMRYGSPNRRDMMYYCEPGWDTLPVPMQPTLRQCMSSPHGKSMDRQNRHGECPSFPATKMVVDQSTGELVNQRQFLTNDKAMDDYFACKAAGGLVDEMDETALRGYMYHATKRAARGETYYPAYNPIVIAWEAMQFHGPGPAGAEVVAAVGVQRESVPLLVDADGFFDATVSMVLVDTVRDGITQTQTPVRTPGASVANASYVLLNASTPAPAGNDVAMRVRVESADGKAGAIAYGTIDIERFPEDSLTMSDIVMSPEDGSGSFTRGAVRLTLAPGRAFRSTEAPTVYYEVYGATPNASLVTEITMDPQRSTVDGVLDRVTGANHALSVRFEEATTQPLPHFGFQLKRALDLKTLSPGNYQMTITVTDVKTGRKTTRRRMIEVQ